MLKRISKMGVALSLVAMFAMPRDASANGRAPASSQIVVDPTNKDHMVMRVTFGALVTYDGGLSWHWICEQAIGFSGVEDPAYTIVQSGGIASATFQGVSASVDGCSWKFAKDAPSTTVDDAGNTHIYDGGQMEKQVFVDLVSRTEDMKKLLAISSGFSNRDDAGTLFFTSRVFNSEDNATTWAQIGNDIDPAIILETVEVAKTDPLRLYLSGARGVGVNPIGVFLASTDGGQHYVETSIPLVKWPEGSKEKDELSVFIAAVSPNDANTLYVRTSVADYSSPTRLFVSNDGGATFKLILTGKGPLLGFALSPDGNTIYVGGPKDGLLMASASSYEWQQKNTMQVHCLTRTADTLWACSNPANFVAAASTDDGVTFSKQLLLNQIVGPVDCPSGSNVQAECVSRWPEQKAILGIPTETDGGDLVVNEDGSVAPPSSAPPATVEGGNGGCSCSLEEGGRFTGPLAGGMLAMMLAYLRRRKRRG